MPTNPATIDAPADGLDRPQPRRFQYPVWWNIPIAPGNEGTKLASFPQLRFYADASAFVRACIDRRIEEIMGLEWDIVPTKVAEKAMGNDKDSRKDFEDRRLKAINFFKRPDPEWDTFHAWLKAALEDMFVIDALSIYLHPTRVPGKGLFGSNLASLDLLAGETIKPILNLHGERPKPPDVAFQQYLWGVPRVDLMDLVIPSEVDEDDYSGVVKEFRGDQLLYLPYRRRTQNPYGQSPVESCLVPIEIELAKQRYIRSYYQEGNVPASFISIGNAESPTQVRQWQDALDAVVGDVGARHQVTVLPTGSTISEMHPNAFNDSYDMVNKEEIMAEFGLTAMEMGLLPGGRSSGLGGKGVAEHSQELQIRSATQPLLNFLKRNIFDYVLQVVGGQSDMQWYWHVNAEDDPNDQVTTLAAAINVGLKTRDEGRVEMGLQPFGLPLTSFPTVPVSQGVVPLAGNGAIDTSSQGQDVETDGQDIDPSQVEQTSPLHQAQVPLSTIQQGDDGTAEPVKYATVEQIKGELEQLKGYLRHGKPIDKFNAVFTPDRIKHRIASNMAGGLSAGSAIADANSVVTQDLSSTHDMAKNIAHQFQAYQSGYVTKDAFVSKARTFMIDTYQKVMGMEDLALTDTIIQKLPSRITTKSCVDMIQEFAIGLACDLTDSTKKTEVNTVDTHNTSNS